MKATELRIGNLVTIDGNVVEIYEVTHGVIEIANGVEPYSINDIEPIPLTEEWLVKLKNDGSFKLRFIKSIAAFEVQRKYVGIESGEEWIFISNVRYVHEWQNLHFALTGEELQADETKKKSTYNLT